MARTKRNDLLAQEIVKPQGLIGGQLFPVLNKMTSSGSIFKIAAGSNANVANTRTAGAVVTPTNNTGTPVGFTLAEVSDRQAVDDSQISMYGGPDRYKLNLARTAALNVAKLSELAVKNAIYALDAMDNDDTLFETINDAIDALKLFPGRIVLAGSSQILREIRSDTTIADQLKNTGMVPAGIDPRFVSNEVLAAALNIDMVFEGRGDVWSTTGLHLQILPDPTFEPHQEIQAGRTIQQVVGEDDGNDMFLQCFEGYDDSRKSEYIDVESFMQAKVLNSSLIKVIDASTLISGSDS